MLASTGLDKGKISGNFSVLEAEITDVTGQPRVFLRKFQDALSLGVKQLYCDGVWDKECFWQTLKVSVFWYKGCWCSLLVISAGGEVR